MGAVPGIRNEDVDFAELVGNYMEYQFNLFSV
jgi:flagellin-like hook-associated protein FlgL